MCLVLSYSSWKSAVILSHNRPRSLVKRFNKASTVSYDQPTRVVSLDPEQTGLVDWDDSEGGM